MKRWDVCLIGSGISSLTAAAILSKQGESVCVLEKHVKPGGYMHCFQRFGARFDTGAHYAGALGPGEPFRALLEYAGVFDESLFVPLDPDGFDELHFPSFEVTVPRGADRMVEALVEKFPGEASGIREYFRCVRETAALFPTYEFRDETDGPALLKALGTSLTAVVTRFISSPRLQCVLYAYCTLHGVKPEEIPFGFHAIVTDSLLRGAYGFRGGGDALAGRFVKLIEKNGGQVVTSAGVERLETRGGEITAVVTRDGQRHEAQWIISGIHPKATFRLVESPESSLSPAFRSRLAALKESPGVFGVYAVCHRAPPFRRDRNYYFHSSEDPRTFLAPRSPEEAPSVAFLARTEREESAGPEALMLHAAGPYSWFEPWRAMRSGKRDPDYEALKKRYAEATLGLVDGFRPGIRESIDRYVTSTPLTNIHFNGSEEGSSYGTYHSIDATGTRAIGPRTHLKNLLLTGQSCLFPGLLGAAISGLRTAGHITGMKPMLRELQRIRGTA